MENNIQYKINFINDELGLQKKLEIIIDDISYISNELNLDEEYFENYDELEEFMNNNIPKIEIFGEKAIISYNLKILRKKINFTFECFTKPISVGKLIDDNIIIKNKIKVLEDKIDTLQNEIIKNSKEEEHRRLILKINELFENIIRDYDEHGVNNNMNLQNPQFLQNVVEIQVTSNYYTHYEFFEKYFSSYKTSLTKDQDKNIYYCNFGRIPIKYEIFTIKLNNFPNYQLSLEKDKSYSFDKNKLIEFLTSNTSPIAHQKPYDKYVFINSIINNELNRIFYPRNTYQESELNGELDYEIYVLQSIRGMFISILEQINRAKIVNAYIKFI